MTEVAGSIKGKLIISLIDIPKVREVFRGLPIRSFKASDSLGTRPDRLPVQNGEPIIKNK